MINYIHFARMSSVSLMLLGKHLFNQKVLIGHVLGLSAMFISKCEARIEGAIII